MFFLPPPPFFPPLPPSFFPPFPPPASDVVAFCRLRFCCCPAAAAAVPERLRSRFWYREAPGTGLRSSGLSDRLLRSRRSSDTPFVSRKAAKPPASGPTVLPIVSRESAKPQSRWLPIWSSRPSPTKPPASSPLILRPPVLHHRCPPPILPIISCEAAKLPA